MRSARSPPGLYPQVALNDKMFYPIYAKCIEVDVAFCSTAGVPGPRLQFAPQEVALIDEVCWFFPELKFVTRHGCEPWTALAVKLLLKWPNLYYSTTAFAPKYYPKDIIDFANTRGADKVIWSGYFPAGLTYDRIFNEMPDVPFRDHVWPKFLRENAQRVFKLPEIRGHATTAVRAAGNDAFEKARAEVGVIDTMIGFPAPREEQAQALRLHPQADARRRQPGVGVPRAVHVQGRAALRQGRRPGRDAHGEDGPARHRQGDSPACPIDGNTKIALERYPDRFFPSTQRDPNQGMDAVRKLDEAVRVHGAQGDALLGHGPHPAGAAERQEDVPDLFEVHRARHPDLRVRGRARAAHPLRAAVRRPARRGVLVLPRAARSSRATAASRGRELMVEAAA